MESPRIESIMRKVLPWNGFFMTVAVVAWWRHQMETFSSLLAICAGNSPVPGEFPAQRPVTRRFDVFFDLRPNKRLSKQWWCWWIETPSRSLWRHRNGLPLVLLNGLSKLAEIPTIHLSQQRKARKFNSNFLQFSYPQSISRSANHRSSNNSQLEACLIPVYRPAWPLDHSIQWRHNKRVIISDHQRFHCLLNCWIKRSSKKTSKLRVTGLCAGIHRWPVNSPHKRPVTRKMLPFDDVIIEITCSHLATHLGEYISVVFCWVSLLIHVQTSKMYS